MSSQKGTSTALIVLVIAVVVVLGGAYFMMNPASTDMQGAEAGAVVEGENAVSGDASIAPEGAVEAVNVEVEAVQ